MNKQDKLNNLAAIARRMTIKAMKESDPVLAAEYRKYARQACQGIQFRNAIDTVDCSY